MVSYSSSARCFLSGHKRVDSGGTCFNFCPLELCSISGQKSGTEDLDFGWKQEENEKTRCAEEFYMHQEFTRRRSGVDIPLQSEAQDGSEKEE